MHLARRNCPQGAAPMSGPLENKGNHYAGNHQRHGRTGKISRRLEL